MKRAVIVLMFLMLVGGVLAMSDPISVKVNPGDFVKLYVRAAGGGPLLGGTPIQGNADDNGIFKAGPMFSLNEPLVNLQIFVIEGDKKILDEKVLNYDTNKSLDIDCSGNGCIAVEERFEVVVENETIVENGSVDSALTGNVVSSEGGSINWVYSIGGFVIVLFLVVFTFGVLRRGKAKRVGVLDEDEKELVDMEKKVRETADKIKSVKDGKARRGKIEAAKVRLAEEEAELKELESEGNGEKVEKQEDVVEKAEDKVEKVED